MIKEVKVIDGCISCRNCETVCPNIFKVKPKSEVISEEFSGNESEILQAELMCPVNVIKVKKEGHFTLSFKEAVLESKKLLTKDTLELKFQTSNFIFKPGQYISVQMKDFRGKFSRSYSIASGNKKSFTLTVKLLANGRGAYFLSKLKPGKKISYLGALGNFYLKNNDNEKVFIATGTGLAPMISMLENTPENIKKTLIFGVRYEDDVYYTKLLEKFKNLKIIIKVSRPWKNFKGDKGRVTDYLSNIDIESEVYICGNPEMVDNVKLGLIERGHPRKNIFNESFTVSKQYPGLTKDIFLNGNIPGINLFSWFIILLGIIGVPLSFNYVDTQNLWDTSWWAVVFVMGIRPLADLLPKFGFLSKLVTLRKAFGILSSSIVITVLIYKFYLTPSSFYNYFTINNFNLTNPLLSRLSEITGLILLITSNTFSQKKLGIWWKITQRSSYLYFISGGIIAATWAPLKIYPAMIIVILLWIAAELKMKLNKK